MPSYLYVLWQLTSELMHKLEELIAAKDLHPGTSQRRSTELIPPSAPASASVAASGAPGDTHVGGADSEQEFDPMEKLEPMFGSYLAK